MQTTGTASAANGSEVLDFSKSVSGFLLRGPGGRLMSLSEFLMTRDFKKVAPKMVSADFRILDAFIDGTRPSPLVLVLHPAERAQSYFLLDSTVGGKRRSMKIFQNAEEIVHNSLEDGNLPVLELDELKQAVWVSRKNQSPISLRIRYLELRESLPKAWKRRIREIFQVNLSPALGKSEAVEERLAMLRGEVRATMFEQYLCHCIWMDSASGQLGAVALLRTHGRDSYRFEPFLGGDAQMMDFLDCIAKDEAGHYVHMGDQANVYPTPQAGRGWASPTLHFYDVDFRERTGVDEHYSLYRGLEKLCEFGAPVLVYVEGEIDTAITVKVLKPSNKGGGLMSRSVPSFASRDIVWQKGLALNA